jgi:hypothetical protein
MANGRTLVELRREGFITAECDRRMGPFLVKDLYGFGDVMGYDPLHLRRPRLVNGCLADVQAHIRKYLLGDTENMPPKFGPNEHLAHLMTWFDLFIYAFGLRRVEEGKKKMWACRKWKAILSPEGKVSFELEEPYGQASS